MSKQKLNIDAFILGAPKCASSWIHRCFMEHQEIFVPEDDSIKYYDINYHKGEDWYAKFYNTVGSEKIVIDPTPSYFRSQWAVPRIAAEFPDAKIILSLRNPVDRAFSQYWHEKKRGIINVDFEDTFKQFMLWGWFIETGLYAKHLENLYKYFPEDRVYVSLFDDLKVNPEEYIKNIFEFLDVDKDFVPAVIGKSVNKAGVDENTAIIKSITSLPKSGVMGRVLNPIRTAVKKSGLRTKIMESMSSKKEYEEGLNSDTRKELLSVYLPDIERLESMIGRDLSDWKK